MPGLDTRGLADGFMRGFSFMENHHQRQHQNERQDRLDQQQVDYRNQQQANWQQSFEANQAQREQQQTNADRTYELQLSQNQQAESQRQWSRERTAKKDGIAADGRQHKQNIEYLTQAYNMAAQGQPFDDRFYEIVRQPRYANFNPQRLLSDEMGKAIQQGLYVMDPETPGDINDPESHEALNYLFDHDINSDRDGKELPGKRRIAGIHPGKKPGTITTEVELEDGSRHPVTERRGTADEGDNTVLQQPVEAMAQKLVGAAQARRFLQTEMGQKAIARMGRGLGLINPPKPQQLDPRVKAQLDINKAKVTQLMKSMGDGLASPEQQAAIQQQISAIDNENKGLLYPGKATPEKTGFDATDLPPAAQHKGRALINPETGQRLISDGTDWVPAQ